MIKIVGDETKREEIEQKLVDLRRRIDESLETERLHFSQEPHDGLIQQLYSIIIQLSGIRSKLSKSDSSKLFYNLLEELHQVIETLRIICSELRPPLLIPFGLEKAIRSHAEQLQQKNPEMVVNLDLMRDDQLLPEQVRLALYHIYQQSISNVLRHAHQASRIDILFHVDAERIVLEIQDNGCGFELPSRWIVFAREGHLGLAGAAERADTIGGIFEVKSKPGEGTLVRVTAPLSPPGRPS